jgi:hypothetical protein
MRMMMEDHHMGSHMHHMSPDSDEEDESMEEYDDPYLDNGPDPDAEMKNEADLAKQEEVP